MPLCIQYIYIQDCFVPRRLAVEETMDAQKKKGTFFLFSMVPRASRLSPITIASSSSRETPEEKEAKYRTCSLNFGLSRFFFSFLFFFFFFESFIRIIKLLFIGMKL